MSQIEKEKVLVIKDELDELIIQNLELKKERDELEADLHSLLDGLGILKGLFGGSPSATIAKLSSKMITGDMSDLFSIGTKVVPVFEKYKLVESANNKTLLPNGNSSE